MILNKRTQKMAHVSDNDHGKRSKMIKLFLYIWSFLPLLLSHHPECEEFKDHTLNFKKVKLYIGCFVGYPSTIIGIQVILFFNINFIISSQILIIIGILLMSIILLSPLKQIKKKKQKIVQKIIIGIGGAFLFCGIRRLPNPPNIRFLLLYFTFGGIISVLNLYHAYGFFSHCYQCTVPFNWGKCSGFSSIQNNLEKYDLNNFLLLIQDFSNYIKMRREKKNSNKTIRKKVSEKVV